MKSLNKIPIATIAFLILLSCKPDVVKNELPKKTADAPLEAVKPEAPKEVETPEAQFDVEEIKAKIQASEHLPPTQEQINSGEGICHCLNQLELFAKIQSAKTQMQFDEKALNASAEDVKKMQDCHTKHVRAGFKNLVGADRMIYAYKAREYANKKCMGGDNNLWLFMGKYAEQRTTPNPF